MRQPKRVNGESRPREYHGQQAGAYRVRNFRNRRVMLQTRWSAPEPVSMTAQDLELGLTSMLSRRRFISPGPGSGVPGLPRAWTNSTDAQNHRAPLRAERLYGLVRESRGLNDVEIAMNLSEQRGPVCIVVENSRRATPNDHDHAPGKFQHIAVTRPRQISQRKWLSLLAERGLDLPPDVAFAMRHWSS